MSILFTLYFTAMYGILSINYHSRLSEIVFNLISFAWLILPLVILLLGGSYFRNVDTVVGICIGLISLVGVQYCDSRLGEKTYL